MLKIAFTVFTGLVGAALLHLIIILALPHFTGLDAYTGVLAKGDLNSFHGVGKRPDGSGLSDGDPFLQSSVCAFDIEDEPVRLLASGDVPFWSLAIYDSSSNEVFSMNDRTSVDGTMDVLVASPVALTTLRKALPESLSQSILVEMWCCARYRRARAFRMVPRRFLQARHATPSPSARRETRRTKPIEAKPKRSRAFPGKVRSGFPFGNA